MAWPANVGRGCGLVPIALLAASCFEPPAGQLAVDIQVVYNEPITSAVVEVRAALWDAEGGGLGAGEPLGWTSTESVGDHLAALYPVVPAGTSLLDIECLALNLQGQTIGRGVTRAAPVLEGDRRPVTCFMVSTAPPDRPDGIEVGLPGAHALESLAIAPEPASCVPFSATYSFVVSDARANRFRLHATGNLARVGLGEAAVDPLRGHLFTAQSLEASPTGSSHTVSVGHGRLERDGLLNLWIVDPDSLGGLAIRATVGCAAGDGLHDVEVRPLAFFHTHGQLLFAVLGDAAGAVSWVCDTNLDGHPELAGSAPASAFLAAQVTGERTFELLLDGLSSDSPAWHRVDCGD